MTSNRTRLLAVLVSAMVLSAPLLQAATTLVITNFGGTLHIVQAVPCGGIVDITTPVAGGRMDVTQTLVRGDVVGAAQFSLTRLEMFYTPFSAHHACNGIDATAEFREIGVRLVGSVKFTGQSIGDHRYRFTIPREEFLLFESVLDNLPVRQPETSYQRPTEDVTGEIDVARGTTELHIALGSRLRFRGGCVGDRCVIDEEGDGRQTTDIEGIAHPPGTDRDADGVPDLTDNCPLVPNRSQSEVPTPVITVPPNVTLSSCRATGIGTAEAVDVCNARPVAIFNNAAARFAVGPNLVTWSANDGIDPIVTGQQTVTIAGDSIPPMVSCTADPPGSKFRVAVSDDCAGPTALKLGTFTLGNGEVIQIQETGKPGVRLLGTVGPDKIRHFQVGKGEAQVMATDAAGNRASVTCK